MSHYWSVTHFWRGNRMFFLDVSLADAESPFRNWMTGACTIGRLRTGYAARAVVVGTDHPLDLTHPCVRGDTV